MGPDNPFVKIGIVLVFVAVVTHFVMQWKNEQDRQVQATATAVTTIATAISAEGGMNVDAVTAAITPLHDVTYKNLVKGLEKTGPSKEEYVAVELILLRIYELDPGAVITTHIKLSGRGKNWPWVFEGTSAYLEPFEMDSGAEIGPIKFLIQMFEEQGSPRKPWLDK